MDDETSLLHRLCNPSRPVFLVGEVPPMEGTPPGKCQTICNKFMARSRALASDGFIVYDIQDEPGRVDNMDRPFPFRQLMDSSRYAALLARTSGKECVVYKCIADPQFEEWLSKATTEHGHAAINLVGRPSSHKKYEGPTLPQAMDLVERHPTAAFGCVCIAERHTLEAAEARGKVYPTEHHTMIRKQSSGARWFISQAVYDPEPTVRLLRDYASQCRIQGLVPAKVILTFCPVSRTKTMDFIKWLGVRVPPEAETQILQAEKPIEASIAFLCGVLRKILSDCVGIGVPLGISCESVSIFKEEIDGVHELFRKLQEILLDARGTPWKVQWVKIMPPAGLLKRGRMDKEEDDSETNNNNNNKLAICSNNKELWTGMGGVMLGGMLVASGVILGSAKRHGR